jgi:hypothetical protein
MRVGAVCQVAEQRIIVVLVCDFLLLEYADFSFRISKSQVAAVNIPLEFCAGRSKEFVLEHREAERSKEIPYHYLAISSATGKFAWMHTVPLNI